MKPPVLAMTMGDPGGVGPEIILKTLAKTKRSGRFTYVIFGARAPFEKLLRHSPASFQFHAWRDALPEKLDPRKFHFVDITGAVPLLLDHPKSHLLSLQQGFDPNRVTLRNAALAYASLEAATRWAVSGRAQAVVTAPIHKTAMRLLEPDFHGHTEYLAERSGAGSFAMMFVSPRLKVTLVTIHEALRKVSVLITRKLVYEKIRLTHEFLVSRMNIRKPHLAVCALNPHGRETGTEEDAEIVPACRRAVREGMRVTGPVSADQLFFDAYHGRCDAVISMYHDQALGPFKMIAFRDGVNVTLGLPFVRTSPDHGTAMDIAYHGKADAASFESALRLAEKLVQKPLRSRRRGA